MYPMLDIVISIQWERDTLLWIATFYVLQLHLKYAPDEMAKQQAKWRVKKMSQTKVRKTEIKMDVSIWYSAEFRPAGSTL